MTAMRVIHTGPERRPHVEPVFEEKEVVDVRIRVGGIEATPEGGASAPNGVGARTGCTISATPAG
jgi:hypothetical protein